MRVRFMRVTNSPGNSSSGKMRGAWSRGTRVESSTNGGAEESGGWARTGLCVCQRDRRAGDRCTRVRAWRRTPERTPWILDVGNDFPSTLSVPERPGRSRATPDDGYRVQTFPSASDDGYSTRCTLRETVSNLIRYNRFLPSRQLHALDPAVTFSYRMPFVGPENLRRRGRDSRL